MHDFSPLKYYDPAPKQEFPETVNVDLCIYGGTSAGLTAAIQASRMGLDVVVVEFGKHLGGMTTGGLGATDINNVGAIGGIAREFYSSIDHHYGRQNGGGFRPWTFEPKVAQNIYMKWLDKEGIRVFLGQQIKTVTKRNGKITEVTMENGNVFKAGIFIDASYEGDLMARSGVTYHVGRESNQTYNEVLNGIHFGDREHDFKTWIDPYVIEGKPDSGLLYGVSDAPIGRQGDGDRSVQAYNFRICLTKDKSNFIPFPQPSGYCPEDFTLLARYIQAGIWDAIQLNVEMPNSKTDLNNRGAVSTDFIGGNHRWPEGDYVEREKIFQAHVRHNLGMLYFLSNDERIPRFIREEVSQWGLPADEFVETGHWPGQLYIREARRMVADIVMTEQHCRGFKTVHDSIGLAAYKIDSHNCRRLVLDGRCVNEGNIEVSVETPFPISYRAIVPKGEECTNLIVPVCASTSHIAYGSIRVEPVFMVLGQSAATAAALALQGDRPVQEVDYAKLRNRLLTDQQVLDWKK